MKQSWHGSPNKGSGDESNSPSSALSLKSKLPTNAPKLLMPDDPLSPRYEAFSPRSTTSPTTSPREKPPQRLTPRGARLYDPYWPKEEIEKGLLGGSLHEGVIAFNPNNRKEAFAKVEGLLMDVLIVGLDQNRAFEGDKVAISLYPHKKWPRVKPADETSSIEGGSDREEEFIVAPGRRQYTQSTLLEFSSKHPRKEESFSKYLSLMKARSPSVPPQPTVRLNLKVSNDSDSTESTSSPNSPQPSPLTSPKATPPTSPKGSHSERESKGSADTAPHPLSSSREIIAEGIEARQDRFKRPLGYVVGLVHAAHLTRNFSGRMSGNPDGNKQHRGDTGAARGGRGGFKGSGKANDADKPFPQDKTALFISSDSRDPKFIVPIEVLPADWISNYDKYRNAIFMVKVETWNENISFPHGSVVSFSLPPHD